MSHFPIHNVLELEYPAAPQIVQQVRDQLERFVRPLQLSRDDLDALKVSLSEACSNAVCHGSPRGALDRVRVRFTMEPHQLVLEVTDEGGGFHLQEISLPDFDEWKPSGRGLFLMQALMDDVAFEPAATGTRVRLALYLPRPGQAQETRPAVHPPARHSQESPAYAPA